MDLTEHRREYASYCSEFETEKFLRHSGHIRTFDRHRLEERYADLWTRERITGLRRACDEVPAEFESERAGLRALAGASSVKLAESRTLEVTEELWRCERSARITWDGAPVTAMEAADLLATEVDARRRMELETHLLNASRACDDLRAARIMSLGEAVRSLGFPDRRALYESYAGADLQSIAAEADLLLERTGHVYSAGLTAWSKDEAAAGLTGGLRYADSFRLSRAARLDGYFPAHSFLAVYTGTLAGLGIRAESQQNLLIDADMRAGKDPRTACFPVSPPQDVRLVLGARASGADLYRRALYEAGRAQMFAWASRDTAARRPEFIYAPDASTQLGHGFLLSGLLGEGAWFGQLARGRTHALSADSRALALAEMHDARRDCAVLGCAIALDHAGDPRTGASAASHAEALTRATGFRLDVAEPLLDADEWFGSATRLRARAFAAGFREHLRARHGRRWFASRGAGDELIDVWNTASRYSVEELARLVWGGALDFDLLAGSLAEAVGARG